jgi:hypothetical protein
LVVVVVLGYTADYRSMMSSGIEVGAKFQFEKLI